MDWDFKKCTVCGRVFMTKNRKQHHCSLACKEKGETVMREIKFRGYNTHDKEWYYGGYYKARNGKTYIVDRFTITPEVVPKSVGQFTGAYDEDGKEIYEGDIVVVQDIALKFTGTLVMHKCCWLIAKEGKSFSGLDWTLEHGTVKVIGNVYDNPELLEVSK